MKDALGYSKDYERCLSELSSATCEDRCCENGYDAWLASDDKWYCEDCLVDRFIDALSELTLDVCGWDGKSDENRLLDGCVYIAGTDDEDEFTHFTVISDYIHCVGKPEITLAMLERREKENEG